ncbi:MAG: ABC transporter permease [Gemmatimonadaceae bacterium]
MSPVPTFAGLRRYLGLTRWGRRATQREVDEELDAHVAMRVAHLVARGRTPEHARLEALRRFGDLASAREALVASAQRRNQRLLVREWLASVRQDAGYALRQMRRAPGFAAFSIATFALGIGLTTAVFATVDAVLLRPLPFPAPGRLVSIQGLDSVGNPVIFVSADNWYDWRRQNRTFTDVAIHMQARVSVRAGEDAVRAPAELVSAGFFRVVQPRLLFGRTFNDSGDAQEATGIVVSESFWRRTLGAKPPAGLHAVVDGVDRDVIGVVAAGEEYPGGRDVWIPYNHRQTGGSSRNAVNWFGIGRLAPGVSIGAATTDLSGVARRIREADPGTLYSYGVRLDPLSDRVVGNVSDYLQLMMGAVLLVLLIACANLASANLARGVSRSREMGVRAALGAGKRRVVRQLLIEHLCVALIGGALGTLLGALLLRAVVASAAAQLPRADTIALDGRVLLFGFLIATITGLVTGVLPAVQASRTPPNAALSGGRGAVRGGRGLPARALVGAEVALAFVLVTCTGLLVQSLRSVLSQPLGFDTSGVVTAQVMLSGPSYAKNQAAKMEYWRRLQTSLRSAPGVETVGLANWIPLEPGGSSFIEIGGRDIPGASAGYRVVGDDYFAALRVAVLSGRPISATDDSTAPPVAVINRAMAERFWPGENPLGRLVRAPSMEGAAGGALPAWRTVVGVVGDVRQYGYEFTPDPELYVPYRQAPGWTYTLTAVVRGHAGDASLVEVVRRRVRDIDPGIAAEIDVLAARAARRTASRRFTMSVLGLFGGLALLLASIGVYGVLSFAVVQRTRELAVRAALGAGRPSLLTLVLASGGRVIMAGLGAGVLGMLLLTKVIGATLYNVSPHNPMVLATSLGTIGVVAFLAALVPAYRATRIAPMIALKGE